jgi:phosphoglycolate phosphatase
MTKSLLVFDLDGTLIDGYEAIGDALGYAMGRLGFERLPDTHVRVLVGNGLERLLEKTVGAKLAPEGVRLFRERYPDVAIAGSRLLPGVAETLERLASRGHAMALASNKPASFSRMILEAKGVSRYFREIGGPDPDTPPKPDPAMLRRMMISAGSACETTLVVGDMEVDVEFARAGGCRVAVIPGGSRSRAALEAAGPDVILEKLEDLEGWISSIARAPDFSPPR